MWPYQLEQSHKKTILQFMEIGGPAHIFVIIRLLQDIISMESFRLV